MSDKVQVTLDLNRLAGSFRDSAAELRLHSIGAWHPMDTGLHELDRALAMVADDVQKFQSALADRFDQHATNLDKVASLYFEVDTSMRELFEDLDDHYGDR
jgi:hypothetical protein